MSHSVTLEKMTEYRSGAVMNGEFLEALQQIAKEKDIPFDILVETVESALATAYKRNNPVSGEIKVHIDSSKAAVSPFKVYCDKTVVEEVTNDYDEILLADARLANPEVQIGEVVAIDIPLGSFGRIAAQTAKQVVVQRIREAERRKIFDEYTERIGEVVTGTVQRREGRIVIIGLGKLDAMLPSGASRSARKIGCASSSRTRWPCTQDTSSTG